MKIFVVVGQGEKPHYYRINADGFEKSEGFFKFYTGQAPKTDTVAQFAESAVIAIIDHEALGGREP